MAAGRHRRDARPSSHSEGRPRVRVVLVLVALGALTTPVTLPSTAAMPDEASLSSDSSAGTVPAASGARPASRSVRIHLRVRGCDDCTLTPVQATARGEVTYRGRTLRPVDGLVRFTLPRHRFRSLGLVLDPTFRTVTDLGPDYPVMVVTQARGTAAGESHLWRDLSGTRAVSGCLPGPAPLRDSLDGTLFAGTVVVRRVRLDGQPRAAAYLREAVPSAPYWTTVCKASKPLADAAVCGPRT